MYNTIQNEVVKALEAKGYEAHAREVVKNGTTLYGVELKVGNVAPCIYVDDKTEVDRAVNALIKAVKDAPNVNIDDFRDFDKVKDKLRLYLSRGEREEVKTTDFLNLKLGVEIDLENVGTSKVTIGLLATWGKPFDEVLDVAKENMEKRVKVITMYDFIVSRSPEMALFMPKPDKDMTIVTTETGNHGASVIVCENVLQRLYDEKGTFYIIPSSIHEVLVAEESFGISPEDLKAMVCEVNDTTVPEEEILAYTVYKYDGVSLIEA